MIGTQDYRIATELLGESFVLGKETLPKIIDVKNTLKNSKVNPQDSFRNEFSSAIDTTYALIVNKHFNYNTKMQLMAKGINDHILKYYSYETIDDFLVDNYLQVPLSFADLSETVGYSISEVGDKAARYRDISDYWQNVDLTWNEIGFTNVIT